MMTKWDTIQADVADAYVYLDEVYDDLVSEYGEGITLAYHEANVAEM